MTLYETKYLHNIDRKKPKQVKVVIKESEASIHCAIADYLNTVIKSPSRWCTVEVSNQQALKRRGVTTGWPDITIMWEQRIVLHKNEFSETSANSGMFKLIFLEVKTLEGKLTPIQETLHQELRNEGHFVYVVRSVADTEKALKEVGMI